MKYLSQIYGRIKTISSFEDFLRRFKNLFILVYKIFTGRYGEKYWAREKERKINLYKTNPDGIKDVNILTDIFNIYYKMRRHAKCEEVYNRIITIAHGDSIADEVYVSMSEIFFFLKKYAESAECLSKIKNEKTKNYHILLFYAFMSAVKLKELENAEKLYKKLLKFRTSDEIKHSVNGIFYDTFSTDKLSVITSSKKYDADKYSEIFNTIHNAEIYNCSDNTDKAAGVLENLKENAFINGDKMLNNLLKNELEISEKQTELSSLPRNLTVTLTNKCNLKCIMCFAGEETFEISEKNLEEIKNIIPYLENISWMGGEVFLYKDFIDILKWASQYSVRQEIITNGLLLSESVIKTLLEKHIDITISIDGTSKEVYENIRRNGCFETLLNNLSVLNKIKKEIKTTSRFRLNAVIMKNNYKNIPDFLELAYKYGFDILAFSPLVRDSRNKELDIFGKDFNSGIIKETAKNINILKDKALLYGIQIENSLPTEDFVENIGSKEYVFNFSVPSSKSLSCHIPWKRLFIASNGDVYPNCFCKKPVGNLTVHGLKELWNCKTMIEYRTRIINDKRKNFCSDDCLHGRISDDSLKYA
ncbi:MAG: radical SAM protein [Endomicrobiaceae bacterium]|jgi:MoaA/NifB/PqqE/SkfB family radical SAM enzyme|nr:radical SAM protein [Endomicrobiaceae bacterium]MDD3730576.1 radical SAM protein [Endomicrobiaceae bacterium]MDD4165716.1 radical SAM protein [Endomicrobiaceae bacterium]